MKPLLLRLRGAIGIRDGLGLDEIDIDFAKFSPGLISIVGKNGSGKTTILDNMHPFLELPSRNGSLNDHFFLRDSFREFVFQFNGKQYRSYILVDARTGKTEAYFYVGGQPINDGRISTYKAEVEKLIGSPEVFFNSVFVAQGASGVTALSPSKRKDLFFELLGLQIYDRYVQYSKCRGDELEKEVAVKKALLEQVAKELPQRVCARETIERAEKVLGEVRREIHVKETEREANEAELQAIRKQAEARARLCQKRQELDDEIATLAQRLDTAQREFEVDKKKLEQQSKAITKEIDRTNQILSHKDEIEEKLKELRSLLEKEQSYSDLERALRDVERKESEAALKSEKEWAEYHRRLAVLEREEDQALAEERRLKIMLDAELAKLEKQLDDARSSAGLVDEVPCHTVEGMPDQCRLLTSAVEARKRVPLLQDRIRMLKQVEHRESPEFYAVRSKLEEIARRKEELDRSKPSPFDREAFTAMRRSIGYDVRRHTEVRERITHLESQKWLRLNEALLVAQSVLKEKEAALAYLNQQMEDQKAKHQAVVDELMKEMNAKREKLNELGPSSPLETEDGRCLWMREEINSALESLRKRELNLHGQISAAQATVDRIEKLESESKQTEQQLGDLLQQIEHWRLLQRACSKDGIPALELDAAGPGISGIANELLASSFGAKFQISFETTKLSKDRKKQLETFNIIVCGEDGEKRIEDLSGGERVWIERAISEAIAIYMSERSGNQFLTTFQDESDGALDPENKQNYFSLLRESFKLGRRYYTFIITQSPDIWEQVAQRIHLKPEQSSIELVY